MNPAWVRRVSAWSGDGIKRDHAHRLLILEGGQQSLTEHADLVRRQIEVWLSAYLAAEGH